MVKSNLKKEKISIALSKPLIQKISEKCRRINRNRSNYIETIVLEDLKKDEPKTAEEKLEIAIKTG